MAAHNSGLAIKFTSRSDRPSDLRLLRSMKSFHALARYCDDRCCLLRSPPSASLTQYWAKFSMDALVFGFDVASAKFRQSQTTRLLTDPATANNIMAIPSIIRAA